MLKRFLVIGLFSFGFFAVLQAQVGDSAEVVRYMRLAGLEPLQDWRASDTTSTTVRVSALVPGGHPLFVRVDFNYNTEIVTWQRGRALYGQNEERGILEEGSYLLPDAEGSSLWHMMDYWWTPHLEGGHGGGIPYILERTDYDRWYHESFDVPGGYLAKTLLSLVDSLKTDQLIYTPLSRYNVEPASFPGGEKVCDAFVDSMNIYPPEALRNFVDNTVRLKFIVERDGTLTRLENPQYQEDKHGFYAEAERLLSIMPRWKPALRDGKPVRSLAECAFRFRVPDSLKPAYGHPILETHRDSICWGGIYRWYLQHTLHPDSYEPYYRMAANYYDEFMLPLVPVTEPTAMDSDFVMEFHIGDFSNNYDRTPVVASPADSALKYYYLFLDHCPEAKSTYGYNDTLGKLLQTYIPIRQLERYLGLPHNPLNRLPFDTVLGLHYPHFVFSDVNDDALPATYDRFDNFDLSDSYFWVQSLSNKLKQMSEPVLYDTTLAPGDTVFRCAFYPSFHPPLSFRIERTAEGAMLYWKKLDYTFDEQTFTTTLHPREGQRKLSRRKYRRLMRLWQELDFDHMPRKHYVIQIDGAAWCLERRTADSFKAHCTNQRNERIIALYAHLVHLAGIDAPYAEKY